MTNKYSEIEDEYCPVCGYYCSGKGGKGCIDKPSLLESEKKFRNGLKNSFSKKTIADIVKEIK